MAAGAMTGLLIGLFTMARPIKSAASLSFKLGLLGAASGVVIGMIAVWWMARRAHDRRWRELD